MGLHNGPPVGSTLVSAHRCLALHDKAVTSIGPLVNHQCATRLVASGSSGHHAADAVVLLSMLSMQWCC